MRCCARDIRISVTSKVPSRASSTALEVQGSYEGDFSGVAEDGESRGKYDAKFRGKYNMFGFKGKYFGKVKNGRFTAVEKSKGASGKSTGDVDYTFIGTYDGEKVFAKASGSYFVKFTPKGFVIAEYGTLVFRVGSLEIKGGYEGFFDGKSFGGRIRGTLDGKKFSIGYEASFEDIQKYIENKGSYEFTCNGETKKGTFDFADSPVHA